MDSSKQNSDDDLKSVYFPKDKLISCQDDPDLFNLHLPDPKMFLNIILEKDNIDLLQSIMGELISLCEEIRIVIPNDITGINNYLKYIFSREKLPINIIKYFILFIRSGFYIKDNDINVVYDNFINNIKLFIKPDQKMIYYFRYENQIKDKKKLRKKIANKGYYLDDNDINYYFDNWRKVESDAINKLYTVKVTKLLKLNKLSNLESYTKYIKWIFDISSFMQITPNSLVNTNINEDIETSIFHKSNINKKVIKELIPYFKEYNCKFIECELYKSYNNCRYCEKLYELNINNYTDELLKENTSIELTIFPKKELLSLINSPDKFKLSLPDPKILFMNILKLDNVDLFYKLYFDIHTIRYKFLIEKYKIDIHSYIELFNSVEQFPINIVRCIYPILEICLTDYGSITKKFYKNMFKRKDELNNNELKYLQYIINITSSEKDDSSSDDNELFEEFNISSNKQHQYYKKIKNYRKKIKNMNDGKYKLLLDLNDVIDSESYLIYIKWLFNLMQITQFDIIEFPKDFDKNFMDSTKSFWHENNKEQINEFIPYVESEEFSLMNCDNSECQIC